MLKSGILIVALAFSTPTLAAAAAPEAPLARESVTFSDLDLGSAAGQRTLRHRIEVAAGNVCDLGGMAQMEDFLESAACYRTAYQDGIRQMQQLVAARAGDAAIAASALVITRK
jgi:UrcA family protein